MLKLISDYEKENPDKIEKGERFFNNLVIINNKDINIFPQVKDSIIWIWARNWKIILYI